MLLMNDYSEVNFISQDTNSCCELDGYISDYAYNEVKSPVPVTLLQGCFTFSSHSLLLKFKCINALSNNNVTHPTKFLSCLTYLILFHFLW